MKIGIVSIDLIETIKNSSGILTEALSLGVFAEHFRAVPHRNFSDMTAIQVQLGKICHSFLAET